MNVALYGLRPFLMLAAWFVGFVVYVVAALTWNGYDGCSTIILVPSCGVVVVTLFLVIALLFGLVLRPTPLGRMWRSSFVMPLVSVVGSLALLIFSSSLGLTSDYVHPETNQPFEAIHPVAAIGGYLILVFAVAHWPLGRFGRRRD